jgi:hypothetical protein
MGASTRRTHRRTVVSIALTPRVSVCGPLAREWIRRRVDAVDRAARLGGRAMDTTEGLCPSSNMSTAVWGVAEESLEVHLAERNSRMVPVPVEVAPSAVRCAVREIRCRRG